MNFPRFIFRPQLINALGQYDRSRFVQDVIAGLTVGVVALPLAMAFAIASGAAPEAGIFTAIIAGFLISALGGSRVQIGGPAGAFIVIIYSIIEKYGLANLLISTILAGVLLFSMGLFRLGSLIRYIPVPIVIGFTNGIAVLIALSQLKDFFGLDIHKMPGDFFQQVSMLILHAPTVDLPTFTVATLSLIVMFIWPILFRNKPNIKRQNRGNKRQPVSRILQSIPATIVVLISATLAVTIFDLQVATIGTKFGGIPQNLPAFKAPSFTWELVKQLFAPTLTIALLGAIESLLCARISDNLTGNRHDPNQELMAQGIANFITPFFGGLPATGTIARTVTNIRAGGTTPVAGIIHALTLLIIILIAAPLAKNVPLAALAAILLYVAFNMGEWHEFTRLLKHSIGYRILMMATFLLTVIVDVTVAVEIGIILACIFFIYRISSLTRIEVIPQTKIGTRLPEDVIAYSIFGSLFFGAVGKLEILLPLHNLPKKAMILELHQLISLDTTGLDALETIHKALQKHGSALILSAPNQQPLSLMQQSGFLDRLGHDRCHVTLQDAIAYAQKLDQSTKEHTVS